MSLELNLRYARSADKTSIVVTDLTGMYNATTNPTGYGGGVNPAASDFSSFNITVTLPDGTTLLPTGTPLAPIDAYPSLPSIASGTFTLTSLALLGTADTTLVDGVYLFEVAADYTLDAVDGTATLSTYKPYYEIVACCVRNKMIEAIDCNCSGDSEKKQQLNYAGMLLTDLSPYVLDDGATIMPSPLEQCGQWDKAARAILELQDVCDNECQGCDGCH